MLQPDSPAHSEPFRLGNLEIRPAEYQVLAEGQRAHLTVKEFELFLGTGAAV